MNFLRSNKEEKESRKETSVDEDGNSDIELTDKPFFLHDILICATYGRIFAIHKTGRIYNLGEKVPH